MNKKTARRKRDLKTKLLAAVAMLLVSSLMMVTTTYAWFTLSTAPEVTGITTAVGANGNLEMALLPYDALSAHTAADDYGITSAAGDGALESIIAKNNTWGNLVDVSDDGSYGMNNLMLYPAELNKTGENITLGAPLKTPVYGADGRITELKANTTTGVYDTGKAQFAEKLTTATGEITNATGVRAIGTSSSLTARELAHRAALAAAVTERGGAQQDASRTLNQNGSAIGNIAIKHALGLDTSGYSWSEIVPLYNAVNDLTNVAGRIEKALVNYVLAYNIASADAETTYADIVSGFSGVSTLEAALLVDGVEGPEDTVYTAAVTALDSLKMAITTAKNALELQKDETGIAWAAVSTAVSGLVDITKINVNGMTMEQIEAPADPEDDKPSGQDQLVTLLSNDNYTARLNMPAGSGVFADIAAFVGDYSASFKMPVEYGGITLPIQTVMSATNTQSYLTAIAASEDIVFEGAGDAGSTNPISTYYGYIIDMAFRTNAANSYLQLQADAIDRIYEDGSNESTMGHGASMTFETTSATFGQAGVKSLMEKIRIVFFDTATGEIRAYAQLDPAKVTTSGEQVTMPIVLTGKTDNDQTPDVDESTHIMALNQNQAHVLSVLVYLDGASIKNADVAADTLQSMSGSMNLQFSSSAALIPMEYNDLKNGTSSVTPTEPTVDLSEVTSGTTGYTVYNAKKQGDSIGFVLTAEDGYDLADKTVTVDFGSGKTATAQGGTVAGVTGYGVTIPDGVTVEATTPITITVTP